MRYSDLDDAIARANNSPYGLNAYVYSRDKEAARQVAQRLEAAGAGVTAQSICQASFEGALTRIIDLVRIALLALFPGVSRQLRLCEH